MAQYYSSYLVSMKHTWLVVQEYDKVPSLMKLCWNVSYGWGHRKLICESSDSIPETIP